MISYLKRCYKLKKYQVKIMNKEFQKIYSCKKSKMKKS